MDVLKPLNTILGNGYISSQLLKELEKKALLSEKKRYRINLHRDLNASIQQMLIYMSSESEVPVHKHSDREETYVLLDGSVKLNIYSEDLKLCNSTILTPVTESGIFIFQTLKNQWHDLEILTPHVLFLETTSGPFSPENTQFVSR